ncbi:arylsulfatase [Paraglaciecola aquimarina]|uniref:Arylsulfatase n=1 Tax=Paraglaciecola aquimarina TaxID=1235557 RepID=A0ABU3SXB0_9ALTE|nr:arylsulfatase [Paraglaciecola aquimarina]MDU0354641.1 arylsulfatase [Paraglaciecola aquimarina]
MNRILAIACCLLLSVFGVNAWSKHHANSDKHQAPNVIVILSDDQGYGDFSVTGNPYVKTPNLDKLATDGIQLTDFHVDPTCSPSRAGLMTGRYSSRVGVWLTFAGRNHLYKEEMTMADVFKHNNYATGIFGKWHLGDNYPFRPTDRGFDKSFIHGGGVAGETPDYWDNDYFDDTYYENGEPVKTQGYTTDVWFDQAQKFINQSQSEQKPFFIYLAANTPHGPFNVEEALFKPYLDKGIPEARARFYAMIGTVDSNVGKLRAYLEEHDLADNTLILYMTDNGTSKGYEGPKNGLPVAGYNANMRGSKTSAYEGGHRAASFWYWPRGGFTGNQTRQQLTAQIDVLPTLVDLLKLTLPKPVDFDGTSLVKVIKDNQDNLAHRKMVIHNQAAFGKPLGDGALVKDKDYVVLQDKWRLVGNKLFNLENDPTQSKDLAKQLPKKAAELQAFYQEWWSDVTQDQRLSPTVINPAKQAEVVLTSQAWSGDIATYDQSHVRAGIRNRGAWYIDVEVAGNYQLEFSRWPKESGLGFNQSYKKDFSEKRLDQGFTLYKLPSQAIHVQAVELILDQQKTMQKVSPQQKTAAFNVHLTKGLHKVEGLLHTQGKDLSAYYMYLTSTD